MPDDTMLPEEDRTLARRLGALLNRRAPLDHTPEHEADDASFLGVLRAYKDAQRDAHAPSAETSARIWTALEEQMAPEQAPTAAPPRPALRRVRSFATIQTLWTWLAAAGVILLVAVGWLVWGRTATPTLLAAAEHDIVTYTTADGSVIRLRPHSQLYALDDEAAAFRLVGEGYFDVQRDETRTFTVEAGTGRVAVLGTRFNVSTWGGQTTVFLEEGQVRFEHVTSNRTVMLAPGQQSQLTGDGRLIAPALAAGSIYTDWLNQELSFDQHSLRLVLAELSHHYALTLDVPATLQGETLTGRILLDGLEQSLHDLGLILGGRFVNVNDTTYRFVSN